MIWVLGCASIPVASHIAPPAALAEGASEQECTWSDTPPRTMFCGEISFSAVHQPASADVDPSAMVEMVARQVEDVRAGQGYPLLRAPWIGGGNLAVRLEEGAGVRALIRYDEGAQQATLCVVAPTRAALSLDDLAARCDVIAPRYELPPPLRPQTGPVLAGVALDIPAGCTAGPHEIKCGDGALLWWEWGERPYAVAGVVDLLSVGWAKGGLTWTEPAERSCVVASEPRPCWAIDVGRPGGPPPMRMFLGVTGTTAWQCAVRRGGDDLPAACGQVIVVR